MKIVISIVVILAVFAVVSIALINLGGGSEGITVSTNTITPTP